MIKPLNDRVLIKPNEIEEKTAGGIYIPNSSKEKQNRGIIVAVGDGTKEDPIVVKVGELAIYSRHAGTEMEIEGEKYIIMRQEEIIAVI